MLVTSTALNREAASATRRQAAKKQRKHEDTGGGGVTQLLGVDTGLSHPLARPTLLFGFLFLLISAVIGGAVPPVSQWAFSQWFGVFTIIVGDMVLTTRRPGRLPPLRLAIAVGLGLAAAALLFIDNQGGSTRIVLAQMAAGLSFFTVRGHPIVGSAAGFSIVIGLVFWETSMGTPWSNPERIAQPSITILGCLGLYFIGRQIAGDRSRAIDEQYIALTKTNAIRTTATGERNAMDEISGRVEPLLERIAAGEPLTDDLRIQVRTADEEVRTLIRPDLPDHSDLHVAIAEARRRGIRIRLIGNTPSLSDALAAQLISLLSTDGLARVTIRFTSPSHGGSIWALLEGSDWIRRYEFTPAGKLHSQL